MAESNHEKETKRKTWHEIVDEYPDMWVYLSDVQWEKDNDATIESAIVSKASRLPCDEMLPDVFGGKFFEAFTTANQALSMGALMA